MLYFKSMESVEGILGAMNFIDFCKTSLAQLVLLGTLIIIKEEFVFHFEAQVGALKFY